MQYAAENEVDGLRGRLQLRAGGAGFHLRVADVSGQGRLFSPISIQYTERYDGIQVETRGHAFSGKQWVRRMGADVYGSKLGLVTAHT